MSVLKRFDFFCVQKSEFSTNIENWAPLTIIFIYVLLEVDLENQTLL